MLGQLIVIWKTGKSDLCGKKDFIPLTLMIGKFDFRTTKTFVRPKKFTQVNNTSLSLIRLEVRTCCFTLLNRILSTFMATGICGRSANMSKGKASTDFKTVALSSQRQE